MFDPFKLHDERSGASASSSYLGATDVNDLEYAVVDVETTGLFPNGHDRVIEIAILKVRGDGEILDEYETLINPDRDLGPTHIHGITGADVSGAPSFSDVAGDISDHLIGAVIVGHNVGFDLSFLVAEYKRLAAIFPATPALCTLRLGSLPFIGSPSRQLSKSCDHFGVAHSGKHSASGDTSATASLLGRYFKIARDHGVKTLGDLGCHADLPSEDAWPKLQGHSPQYPRTMASRQKADQSRRLGRLISRLPARAETGSDIHSYFELLDRALEDRNLTDDEVEALAEMAVEGGLSKEQVMDAHQTYVNDLAHAALEDGIVTQAERADLEAVVTLLGLSSAVLDQLLEIRGDKLDDAENQASSQPAEELSGQSVCFTGTSRCTINGTPVTKQKAQSLAVEAGIIVSKNVTLDLDILVVADPDTMSGKAKKARGYGVRIISEHVFWKKIGVDVD